MRLAEEGFRNGLADPELAWLASREAVNVWVFGKHLAEVDRQCSLLTRIIDVSPDDDNGLFLAAYLERSDESRESAVDKACQDRACAGGKSEPAGVRTLG